MSEDKEFESVKFLKVDVDEVGVSLSSLGILSSLEWNIPVNICHKVITPPPKSNSKNHF